MTNIKLHPTQAGNKPSIQTAKKADPFAVLKSSIMIVSIVGTMAGWLILLNQETDTPPVNAAAFSTVSLENDESAIESTPITHINQLRQVNEVAPAQPIAVVARTRSSR